MGIRYKPELEATKVPTAIDTAWSAGIYEGEGCVQLTTKGRINCRVTQKDPELLYRLRDWFGGSIVCQGSCSAWLVCGDRAKHFMALIYVFLTARRRAQVDELNMMKFLRGENPTSLSSEQIWGLLDSKLSEWRRLTPEMRRQQKVESYRRLRQDPEYVARCRANSTAYYQRQKSQKAAAKQPETVN